MNIVAVKFWRYSPFSRHPGLQNESMYSRYICVLAFSLWKLHTFLESAVGSKSKSVILGGEGGGGVKRRCTNWIVEKY